MSRRRRADGGASKLDAMGLSRYFHVFLLAAILGFTVSSMMSPYVLSSKKNMRVSLSKIGRVSGIGAMFSPSENWGDEEIEDNGEVYYEKSKKIVRRAEKSDIFEIFKLKEGMIRAVCRFPKACRMEDGTILLPDFMKIHESTFKKKCGLMSFYRFYRFNQSQPTQSGYEGFDLFGTQVPRDHMPHFITDFFPQFTAIDIVMGQRNASTVVYSCLLPDGKRCARARPTTSGINPSMFIHPKIEHAAEDSWVRSFVGAMPRKPGPGPRLIFPAEYKKLQSDSGQSQNSMLLSRGDLPAPQGMCFKSLIFNPHYMIPAAVSVNHIMYRMNGIKRSPRKLCDKRITIVDRNGNLVRGGFPIGRNIVGAETLEDRIRSAAFKAGLGEVTVDRMYFDNLPYSEQVEVMQRTDVLLAPHGAAITNSAFMRANSSALEILPFGYVANIYPIITRAFTIKYGAMTSEPDDEQFANCVKHYNPPGSIGGVPAEDAIRQFRQVAESWKALGESDRIKFEQTAEYNLNKFPIQDVKNQRPCLRAQRLIVDLNELAKRTVDMLKKQCERHSGDDTEAEEEYKEFSEADVQNAED